jgi:HTH-type transcriptional regulator/antitoxin HigA
MKDLELKPIKSEQEYDLYLDWVDVQFDNDVEPGSQIGNKLEIALLLIKDYEDKFHPIPYPDAIEVIKQKMEDNGLRNKDLVELVGSKSYVSAILNKRKPLTLKLAKLFHQKLGIPSDVLLAS